MVYLALLQLMRTPRLSVFDWTDAHRPLLRCAERRNLVSPRVSSYFKCSLHFDDKMPQHVISLCSYVMRRLTVSFVLRIQLHDFAMRTRNNSSPSCPYFHLPHVSIQLLSTHHHCGRYRVILSLLVCVQSVISDIFQSSFGNRPRNYSYAAS